MEKMKEGITKRETDKVQPWRVWFGGKIIWFARTEEEARQKLEKEKRRNWEVKKDGE